jgi:tetratricopeptide (TPR) repeat protein
MKKLAYPLLIVGLLTTLGFVYRNYEQKKNAIPTLQNRSEKQTISTGSEWLNTKAAIESLLDQLRRHPDDMKAKLQLAMAYVQESRVTGNHAYYDEAAFKLVSQVLEKEPTNYEGLCVKTTILLSQHHFADALTAATEFSKLYPDAAFGYGLLTDANLELGNYAAAIAACDKMNGIRPDLRSYSRAAYLREIHGDYVGAKDAMSLAVKAGVPALEQTEWCRVQLGHLYEKTNEWAKAEALYRESLATRPDYAYALAGLGRVAMQKGNYTEGVTFFEKAALQTADFDFQDKIIDCLEKIDPAKAKEAAQKLVAELQKHATDEKAAAEKGHYADKELAYVYLKMGDNKLALEHATREWLRRPENVEVNECLAWVYFKNNDFAQAKMYIERALKTGSKDPVLLERKAQIMAKG